MEQCPQESGEEDDEGGRDHPDLLARVAPHPPVGEAPGRGRRLPVDAPVGPIHAQMRGATSSRSRLVVKAGPGHARPDTAEHLSRSTPSARLAQTCLAASTADPVSLGSDATPDAGCRNDCRDRSLTFLVPGSGSTTIALENLALRHQLWSASGRRPTAPVARPNLDHFLILSEAHLRRLLHAYTAYYNTTRPHQSLDKNSPQPRAIEPPPCGRIIAIPQVGGLHHRYQRAA
jgi:hypothetical protein